MVRKHSEETKNKISNSTKGKILTQETKNNISKGKKGKKMNPSHYASYIKSRAKPVLQFSLEGKFIQEFNSTKEAARATGAGAVMDCCKNYQKQSNGFIFKFKDNNNNNNNNTDDLILLPQKESFILWKCPIEITKEIRDIKGKNYKGRDIGPFQRLCPQCKTNILDYPTYDIMLSAERNKQTCKECNKNTKGKKGQYSKKCSNADCNEIIYYKYLGDYRGGIENKTICQKCKNKKNSELYLGRGIKGYLAEKEGQAGIDRWEEANQRREESFKKYWEEHPEQLEELVLKRGGHSKIFFINNIKCQGSSEKAYIELLIKENKLLPKRAKGVKTSLGFYFPDFEFEDRYIEIKSSYTYSLLFTNNKLQYEKILETSKIKPVEIILVDKNKIVRNIIFK